NNIAKWTKKICGLILDKTGKEVSEYDNSVENVLLNPDLLVQEIKKFHELTINYTAGYNPTTFSIWSLRKNTRRYVSALYQGLETEENFARICQLLGLSELFKPKMADPSAYIVYGFREYGENYYPYNASNKLTNSNPEDFKKFTQEFTSVGSLICFLNELIWEYFSKVKLSVVIEPHMMNLEKIITNLPDLKKDYFDKVTLSLTEKPLVDVSHESSYNFEGLSINRVAGHRSGSVPSIALTDALDSVSEHQFFGAIEYNVSTWGNGEQGSLRINIRRA
ncbi:MAG: hypothetical protein ACRDF4_03540, partial [Rhabdochlamydiaceae bacterium]